MTKNTMGTKLPRKLEQKMRIVGEQIRLARLRRNLSVAQIAERATCSPLTVSRIEKGASTVAIGIYLRAFFLSALYGGFNMPIVGDFCFISTIMFGFSPLSK